MKENNLNKLIEKYHDGNISLEEEAELNNLLKNSDNEEEKEDWLSFARQNKIETPVDFNTKMWETFEKKQHFKSNKTRFRVLSAVATIALLIAIGFALPKTNELSYSEKENLLLEAQAMFKETSENEATILFEDETIIVYTNN